MRGFDPITQLAAREAVRFVGTVADVTSNALDIYVSVLLTFKSKEVRTMDELAAVVQRTTSEKYKDGKACSVSVARHTVEVVTGLRLLNSIPQVLEGTRKFTLGDSGRVVVALLSHPRVDQLSWPILFRRPFFEAHGDYLLQAMSAFKEAKNREEELVRFTAHVRALMQAKSDELPSLRKSASWDLYAQEIRTRRNAINVQGATEDPERPPNIEALKRAKKEKLDAAIRGYRTKDRQERPPAAQSKTFLHQLSRCRAWLAELGFVQRGQGRTRLTKEGARVLAYFEAQCTLGSPLRIPPSAALLKDAFRVSDEFIKEVWGALVDDGYWERGLYDISALGIYSPSDTEFMDCVDWGFREVKVSQVSEASLPALRQVVFMAFLLKDKPIRSDALDMLFREMFEQHGDIYGLGRNRQGRPAFIFQKKPTAL